MWYELWLYAYNHGGECYWAIMIEGAHTGFLQNRDDNVILEAWGDYRHQQGEVKDVCEDICHYVSSMVSWCGGAMQAVVQNTAVNSGQIKRWDEVFTIRREFYAHINSPALTQLCTVLTVIERTERSIGTMVKSETVGSTHVSVKLKTLQSLTGRSSSSLALARRMLGSGECCCLFLSLTRTRGLFNPFLRRFFHTHVQSIGVVPDCEYLRTSKRVSVIGDQCIAC